MNTKRPIVGPFKSEVKFKTQTKAAEYQKTHRMNEIKGRILAEMSAIATC